MGLVKKLITLRDWNRQVGESVHDWMCNEQKPNGISCEKCGHELNDTMPNMVCASNPPKKSINIFMRCENIRTKTCNNSRCKYRQS